MITLWECLARLKDVEDRGIMIRRTWDPGSFVSYRQFYETAVFTGRALRRAGIEKGSELILSLDDTLTFLSVFWGCVSQGIRVVPYRVSAENIDALANIEAICDSPRLITDNTELIPLLKSAVEIPVTLYKQLNLSPLTAEDEWAFSLPVLCEQDIVYIQFSSGSTSDVKGVGLTNKNLYYFLEAFQQVFHLQPNEGFISWMPLYHNMGLIGGNFLPIYAQTNQCLIPTDVFIKDPVLWGQCCHDYGPRISIITNYAMHLFVKTIQSLSPGSIHWDLSRLHSVISGGEPVSQELLAMFLDSMAAYGIPSDVISPAYGMAESTLAVSLLPVGAPYQALAIDMDYMGIGDAIRQVDDAHPKRSVITGVGNPIPYMNVRVADLDNRTLPEDHIGLLYIKGNSVINRYYRKDVPEAFVDGWFNTGDICFVHEGQLYITGRYKNLIIYNGKNYYTNDIEEFIQKRFPSVREQVYIIGYRQTQADLNDTIVCFLKERETLQETSALSQNICDGIHQSLGILIDRVAPVVTFPKTVSGKIKRYALLEQYRAGDFNDAIARLEAVGKIEGGAEEDISIDDIDLFLEEAVREQVGDDVDTEDSFIRMGLTSDDISRLFIRIDERYKGLLTISDLFAYSRISELSAYIGERMNYRQYQ